MTDGPAALFNPYPGLRPFLDTESHLFFGRSSQVDDLLAELGRARFVAVTGPSGSGKSSLVRAGLLPALHGGFHLRAGARWRVATIRPGGAPVRHLARALAAPDVLGDDGQDWGVTTAGIEATLRRSSLGLADSVHRGPDGGRVLVIVDQFEELFRFGGSDPDRDDGARFVQLLIHAARDRHAPIDVILTMRSDFLGDCARFRDLPEAVSEGLYLVPRLTRTQLEEAITAPAAVGGGAISRRLVQRLLNDGSDDPDVLPVLQHALMRSWDLWTERAPATGPVDVAHYEAAGGLEEALARHADEAYAELGDDRRRRAAELMFKRLTEVADDHREVRRPTSLDELAEVTGIGADELVDIIAEFQEQGRSFLTVSDDRMVDISHESLIRQWPRLRRWASEEAESRVLFERLTNAAARRDRGEAALLRNPELQIAADWWRETEPTAAWAERYSPGFERADAYLRESRLAARRRKLLAGAAVAALALLALISVLLAMQARNERNKADVLAREATTLHLATSSALAAERDPELAALLALQAARVAGSDRGQLGLVAAQALRFAVAAPWQGTLRHDGAVGAIAFSPDGSRLATAADDGTVRIWQADGTAVATLDHGAPVNAVAFAPDGATLVSAGDDGTARLWAAGGASLAQLPHNDAVVAAAFSPDGELVVTASTDRSASIWRADGSRLAGLLHDGPVRSAAFSPDGEIVLTASDDGTARRWGRDGSPMGTLRFGAALTSAAFDPTGTRLVTTSIDGTARLWDAATLSPASSPIAELSHAGAIRSAAFSPDGSLIVTAAEDRTAGVWRVDGTPVATLRHDDVVTDARFSPDGSRIVTSSFDVTARVWAVDGTELATLTGHTRGVAAARFAPDGTRVVTASDDGTARIWDPGGLQLAIVARHDDKAQSASFSADGSRIVTTSSDGTAVVRDGSGGALVELRHDGVVNTGRFSPDGTLVVTASHDRTARVWDTDGTLLRTLRHPDVVRSAYFSPDGTRIVTAGDHGVAVLWDLEGQTLARFHHDAAVRSARFSDDGGSIVTASHDGTARIWDAGSEGDVRLPALRLVHDERVRSAELNPQGDLVATAPGDGVPVVWGTTIGGARVARLVGHLSPVVSSVGWSPDGTHVVTAGQDRTARVWHGLSGTLVATLEGHSAWVNTAQFSPDGTRILTASDDGTVRLWEWFATDQDVREELARRLGDRRFTQEECARFRIDPCTSPLP